MYLMELGALMKHFHYRSNHIASHTRHPETHSICTAKPFKEELKWLQQQGIITPLGVDETLELCQELCTGAKTQWNCQSLMSNYV